jgi:hypothetical protein
MVEEMEDSMVILESSEDDEPWPSRTIAELRGETIRIRHQYLKVGRWCTWQDMGSSFPASTLEKMMELRDGN